MNIVAEIIRLNDKWHNCTKEVISENIQKEFEKKGIGDFQTKIKTLSKITGSSKETAYAWVNCSRKDVKIPFIKLCKLSLALDINIENFLE